ncbi:MAG: DUF3459 domain-containing protein [Pseudomonadota bacterium]
MTIPDPEDEATFDTSKLDWNNRTVAEHGRFLDITRNLIACRRQHVVPLLAETEGFAGGFEAIGDRGLAVSWQLAQNRRLSMVAQLADQSAYGFDRPAGEVIWTSRADVMGDLARGQLPSWSVAYFLTGAPL